MGSDSENRTYRKTYAGGVNHRLLSGEEDVLTIPDDTISEVNGSPFKANRARHTPNRLRISISDKKSPLFINDLDPTDQSNAQNSISDNTLQSNSSLFVVERPIKA